MAAVDPVVESRDWSAWENHQPPGPISFHVSGTVTVKATNYSAHLEKAIPQGFNPEVLILLLDIRKTDEVGGDAITDLPVKFEEVDYQAGRYTSVHVLRHGKGGTLIPDVTIVT